MSEPTIDRDLALRLQRSMLEIRAFEERVSTLYRDGSLPGFIHLSLGQEACAAGACLALERDDYVTSTHRGHGHCLAKGADPRRMMAELYGRAEGYSRGRGGSMHIADVSVGVLGANGIVGQSSPLALGAALTSQVQGLGRVAVAFFGEGASGAGPTLEAMNIARLWMLPVVFFCEVNGYAEMSPFSTHCPLDDLAQRASGFGFEGVGVDGSDVGAVWQTVRTAVAKARGGGGPTLIAARTHRWHGHYEGDPQKYVDAARRDPANRIDPIVRWSQRLVAQYGFTTAELEAEAADIRARIDAAVEFARALPPPPPALMMEDVYA